MVPAIPQRERIEFSLMVRVGFTLIGGTGWQGGHHYLVNLLRSMTKIEDSGLAVFLFVGATDAESDVAEFLDIPGLTVVPHSAFNRQRRTMSQIKAIILGHDRARIAVLKANGIDVVFEAADYFGWRIKMSAIAWVPDFQHQDLPHLFSKIGWWKREIGIRAQILSDRTVMLSSADAKRVLRANYQVGEDKARIVNFAVPYPRHDSGLGDSELLAKYNIPSSYVFLPNQFWKHKNHLLVIEALALLRTQGRDDITVVTTGNLNDSRNAKYIDEVKEAVIRSQVQEQFLMLGMIPFSHVLQLLKSAHVMLNPSLYEGWSTTVEEARAAGTPLILSDLAVHKEQMGPGALYFDRYSAADLAAVLSDFKAKAPDADLSALVEQADARVAKFARCFQELVLDVHANAQRLD